MSKITKFEEEISIVSSGDPLRKEEEGSKEIGVKSFPSHVRSNYDVEADKNNIRQGFKEAMIDIDESKVLDAPESSWGVNEFFCLRWFFVWFYPYLIRFFFKTPTLQDLPRIPNEAKTIEVEKRFDYIWPKLKGFPFRFLLSVNYCFGIQFWIAGIIQFFATLGQVFIPKIMEKFLNLLFKPLESELSNEIKDGVDSLRTILPEDHIIYPPEISEFTRPNNYEIWIWLCLLVLVYSFSTWGMNYSIHLSAKVGMKVRTILVSKVYQKSLKLSNKARGKYENGVIMSHVSVDAIKIEQVHLMFHQGWTSWILIFGSIYFLYDFIGLGAFTGTAGNFIHIPLVVFIVLFYISIRLCLAKLIDKRVQRTNEVLQSIRIIKFFAWEESFLKRIRKIRCIEVTLSRILYCVLITTLIGFVVSQTNFVCLIAYVTYYLENGYLESVAVFTSLTYFMMMRVPLTMAPSIIIMVIEMMISMDRIAKLLEADELEVLEKSDDYDNPIIIENGNFKWEKTKRDEEDEQKKKKKKKGEKIMKLLKIICCKKEKEEDKKKEEKEEESEKNQKLGQLVDINLCVKKGDLVMVIGEVGSGKSSLLSAILGEMKKEDGRMVVSGNFCYTSQLSWIQNNTLYGNVIFGQNDNSNEEKMKKEEQKWREIVECCQLQQDLDEFKGGRNIEIGEKGINLSGGQKYRVQLARACYASKKDNYEDNEDIILLLDDPLAAVDAHVGKKIFHQCIKGFLEGKTRVLVTHQLNYIKFADWIVLMDEGRILEQGKYDSFMEDQESKVYQLVSEYIENTKKQKKKKKKKIGEENLSSCDEEEEVEEILSPMSPMSPIRSFLEEEKIDRLIRRGKEESKRNSKKRRKERKQRRKEREEKRRRKMMNYYNNDDDHKKEEKEEEENKIIASEEIKKGMISPKTVLTYISAMGPCWGLLPLFLICCAYLYCQLGRTASELWLAEWTDQTYNEKFSKEYEIGVYLDESMEYVFFDVQQYPEDYELFGTLEYNSSMPISTTNVPIYINNEGRYLNCTALDPRYGIVSDFEEYECPSPYGPCGCHYQTFDAFYSRDWEGEKIEDGLTNLESVYVYASLGIALLVNSWIRTFILLWFAITAAQSLHNRALQRVLLAPMSFFDTTPVGRIIARFSHDLTQVDGQLIMAEMILLGGGVNCLGMFFMISYLSDGLGSGFVVVLLIFYLICYIFYRRTNLELKRLESVSKSPVMSHISETLNGMMTIRAYDSQERFIDTLRKRIDINNRAYYLMVTSQRWLGMYLGLVGNCFVFCVCVMMIMIYYYWEIDLERSYASLALSYSITSTHTFYGVIERLCECEVYFNSVERLDFYAKNIPVEDPFDRSRRKPKNYLRHGRIQFINYSMKYRKNLDLVLKSLNFEVLPGERLGIVGRTGSGKSSLIIALFRIVEAARGRIELDGHDISELNLIQLRNSLSIIPQDATLFSGTVRSNLDPFNQYSDEEIWTSLSRSFMDKKIRMLPGKLKAGMKAGGSNFSVGERQLLCLARALLRDTKIIVFDEATASVDISTDSKIQRTIRENFKNCTTLTIAHRIETIIDCDRILVMEDGKVAELDTPRNLLADTEKFHVFRDLVSETGENTENLLYDYAFGRKKLEYDVVLQSDDNDELQKKKVFVEGLEVMDFGNIEEEHVEEEEEDSSSSTSSSSSDNIDEMII